MKSKSVLPPLLPPQPIPVRRRKDYGVKERQSRADRSNPPHHPRLSCRCALAKAQEAKSTQGSPRRLSIRKSCWRGANLRAADRHHTEAFRVAALTVMAGVSHLKAHRTPGIIKRDTVGGGGPIVNTRGGERKFPSPEGYLLNGIKEAFSLKNLLTSTMLYIK